MSRIICVEAHWECVVGKAAVGNVIMNRTKSPTFPDTVRDVIFDRHHGIQFPPAHTASFSNREPDEECIIAAKIALEGVDIIEDSLYFNQAGRTSWAARNRPHVKTLGKHDFYA
jgi:spore germination cell wall hydrolase CwlJ-like protein